MKNEFEALANNSERSEKAIEKYLVRRMEGIGGKALKYTNANHSGYPDRICLSPTGVVAFVEIKGMRGRLSLLQAKRLSELCDLGFVAAVCRSKEDVDRLVGFIQSRFLYIEDFYALQPLPVSK